MSTAFTAPLSPRHDRGEAAGKQSQWDRVANMDEFKLLLLAKKGFVVPATIFFVVYYFALPVLVGYAPELMDKKVLGPVNLAYLFALSQFFMAWGIAWLYVRAARKFDDFGKRIMQRLQHEEEGK
jgi:uncharacterized membrane protein (DUF485 family)